MSDIELISPLGKGVFINKKMKKPSINVSKKHLDKFLPDRALNEGAKIIKEKVQKVRKKRATS